MTRYVLPSTVIGRSFHCVVTNEPRNVISIMNELNVRRLIQVSTASYRDPEDGFGLKSKALVTLFKVIARSSYDDIKTTGELVADSDLDWTLVRSAFLKDGPADGGLAVGSYGRTKLGMKLSKGHLAKFLFDQVSSREFVRATSGIAGHLQPDMEAHGRAHEH
ncbi:NAD(P)H-binding protein [Mesorhizobium sp. VK25A]|uniref:NAD(P)H-binding protein n=2 Tax=Mesorhizobium TaxID=68287 RepID=A0ABU5AC87_9HYPH|nr:MULTISPECIES: NAD(P)H-binding protein [unclassified Mesorhizobium]MDX8469859.1 NAD(P)H-binding protein [Mesorhizobium sp. VK23B]MDX8476198.1 NAD(P)H-binding protein [Mesorhizobium sp. VK23A]MDX8505553.1 NAD(P)H-binding protein [Mesorhizobium sp. VK22E]MDX8534222.1 NAD(P)H-binding protein [Mesorhizobium sp. VK25D]MDX8546791.1 NAD(P)H-binding protein [Mesorhizobium sp. VK25A]